MSDVSNQRPQPHAGHLPATRPIETVVELAAVEEWQQEAHLVQGPCPDLGPAAGCPARLLSGHCHWAAFYQQAVYCRTDFVEKTIAGQDAEANDAQHELKVRLDALRLLQEMYLPSLPQSLALKTLRAAVSTCPEAQQEEMEGHCAPEQLEFLRSFVAERFGSPRFQGGLRMCQIGFNAGHSAAALLDQAPEGSVLLSLDLGQHAYTRPLEQVVSRIAKDKDQTHILLEGNSAEMLPRFRHIEFDLIFIDGNHAYEAVKLDMLLCLQMATEDTLVLLNHVFTDMTEGLGPTKVWLETLREGEAKQIGWHSCCSRHGIAIAKRCAGQRVIRHIQWMQQTVLK
eukprot:s1680_g6.t1